MAQVNPIQGVQNQYKGENVEYFRHVGIDDIIFNMLCWLYRRLNCLTQLFY
jgi:hypothetical protein